MNRLTKRFKDTNIAYMAIGETLNERDQELEGSKLMLEGIYAIFQKLAAYEDTGLEPEEVKQLNASDASKEESSIKYYNEMRKYRDELKYYKKLEAQGLLIKLPCKVGDIVYCPDEDKIQEFEVMGINIGGTKHDFSLSLRNNETYEYWRVYKNCLNTIIFLTREEAEKALEEMNENK